MNYKTFGKAPYKINFKHFINQSEEPLKTQYQHLKIMNDLFQKVEGSKVTANRFGMYLFANNFTITLDSLIKSMAYKVPMHLELSSRQLLEQYVYLREIFDNEDPRKPKGWDKLAANFRFYAGYILWTEIKEYQIAVEDPYFSSSFELEDKEYEQELKDEGFKPSDIPSLMFHDAKRLISALKLEYVVSQLDRLKDEMGKTPSLLDALCKFSKTMTGRHIDYNGVFGGMIYRNHSRKAHGIWNSLCVSALKVSAGNDLLKISINDQRISLDQSKTITDVMMAIFKHFWPKEFSVNSSTKYK